MALRLLGQLYKKNASGQSAAEFFSNLETFPQEILAKAHQAFPYYSLEDIKGIFNEVKSLAVQHLPLNQIYSFITKQKFRKSIQGIVSNVLLHFVHKDFILSALENGFLAPSVINYNEYEPIHFGCPENQLFKNTQFSENIRECWEKSNGFLKSLKDTIGKGLQPEDRSLNTKIKLPFVSCFTEVPLKAIDFHAEHYGAFGIAFKKSHLLNEARFQTVRPVSYLDSCNSSVIPLLIAALEKNWDSHDTRILLLKDLFLTKPHHKMGFDPENAFSTYYEREWRYVSEKTWFEFSSEDIDFVTVPKYAINGLEDNALKENGSVNQSAWNDGHNLQNSEHWISYRVLETAEKLKIKVKTIPIES